MLHNACAEYVWALYLGEMAWWEFIGRSTTREERGALNDALLDAIILLPDG